MISLGYAGRGAAVVAGASAALSLAACGDAPPVAPERAPAPVIDSARVSAGPWNVLSAVVHVSVRDADSVVVRVHLKGAGAGADSVTPAARVVGDTASPLVLGLWPARDYVMRAVAYGPGGATTGDSLAFTTGALPADLPRFRARGVVAQRGFVVFASGSYGVVIDDTGRVAWYRRVAGGVGLNFVAEPGGFYAAHPPVRPPGRAPWVLFDPSGSQVRSLECAGGLPSRPHELLLEPGGAYWLLCDSTRTMDLASLGGSATARVTGTVVQHVAADGTLLFQWSPFDHLAISDLDPADRADADVNWTHGNALAFDSDGNLLVSFRSLSEITKIDVHTGDVIWRLGGRANQFAVTGSPTPPFVHQHGLRLLRGGVLLLLDNLGEPSASRAELWTLDASARTARLARSYASLPSVVTPIGGSVQALPLGHILVSFGTAGRVEEYDASGRVVWRIEGNAGYVFRAQRFRSLYAPGRDASR